MEENHRFPWASSCRLCLNSDNTELGFDIFDEGSDNILAKINECFDTTIYVGDPLSNKICGSCWKSLNMWLTLKARFEETTIKINQSLEEYTNHSNVRQYLMKLKDKESPTAKAKSLDGHSEASSTEFGCKEVVMNLLAKTQEIQKENNLIDGEDLLNDDGEVSVTGVPGKTSPSTNGINQSQDPENEVVTIECSPYDSGPTERVKMEIDDDVQKENEGCHEKLNSFTENEKQDIKPVDTSVDVQDTKANNSSPRVFEVFEIDTDDDDGDDYPVKTEEMEENMDASAYLSDDNIESLNDENNDDVSNATDSETPIADVTLSSTLEETTTNSPALPQHGESILNPLPFEPDVLIDVNIKSEMLDDVEWPQKIGAISSVEGSADAVHFGASTNNLKEEILDEPANNDPSYNLRPRRDFMSILYEGDFTDDKPPTPLNESQDENVESKKLTPWKCTACLIHFSSRSSLTRHYGTPRCKGSSLKPFPCEVCSRLFFSETELAEHQIVHLGIEYHVTSDNLLCCGDCKQNFSDMDRLIKHAKTHEQKPKSISRFRCRQCRRSFSKRSSFNIHLRTHVKVQTTEEGSDPIITTNVPIQMPTEFSCSLCPKRFKGEDLLYDHRFAFHGIPDERMSCETCGLKFRDFTQLAIHNKTHRSGQTARKKTSQNTPVMKRESTDVVVENKPIRCLLCGKLFPTAEELQQHESIQHKNATPHCCRKCLQKFPTRSGLLLHHRTHGTQFQLFEESGSASQDANNMSCNICRVTFKADSDYKKHMECHNITPGKCRWNLRSGKSYTFRYQCSHCPQLFCSMGSILKHRLGVHSGDLITFERLNKPITKSIGSLQSKFKCHECRVHFKTAAKLNFHISNKHDTIADILTDNSSPSSAMTTVKCPICYEPILSSEIAQHIIEIHDSKSDQKPAAIVPTTSKSSDNTCKYCSKVCSTSYNLQKHEACHELKNSRDIPCKNCHKHFDNYTEYTHHRKHCKSSMASPRFTPPSPKSLKDRPTLSISSLAQGVTISKVTPKSSRPTPPIGSPRSCPICMKRYDTANVMELHVVTVHGPDALQQLQKQGLNAAGQVAVTGKRTSSDIEIWNEESNKMVRVINGGIRCTLCKISLANNQLAMRHKMSHPRGNMYLVQIGDSLYQCTVCDNFFSSRQQALEHALLHAEPSGKFNPEQNQLRTFNCPFCSSMFGSEDSIRSHIFYVHPEGTINLS